MKEMDPFNYRGKYKHGSMYKNFSISSLVPLTEIGPRLPSNNILTQTKHHALLSFDTWQSSKPSSITKVAHLFFKINKDLLWTKHILGHQYHFHSTNKLQHKKKHNAAAQWAHSEQEKHNNPCVQAHMHKMKDKKMESLQNKSHNPKNSQTNSQHENVHVCVWICMCVCVCVWKRERGRESIKTNTETRPPLDKE